VAKLRTVLIASGTLIIIGIGISFYQSQIEMDDLTTQQQSLATDESMTVSKNLDPAKNKNGVYSVQISDFKNGDNLKANVITPTGSVVAARSIAKNPFQENFTISQSGNYTLLVQNTGQRGMQILGMIGYYPQGATILDVLGVIILISGLSGLAVGIIYFIKRRAKTGVS